MTGRQTARRQVIGGAPHAATVWNAGAPGPNLLALHGFAGAGLDWAPVAERLRHPVLAPDLLGHGRSPAPAAVEAYRIEAVVDHCLRWCDGAADWVVLGYSMGGRVALRLAPRLGKRLRGLVLVSTSPGIVSAADRRTRSQRDQDLADRIEAEGIGWFCEHWARQPIIQSQQRIVAPVRDAMQARRRANRAVGIAGSLRGMGQGAVAPVWQELGRIACPTLWLTGDEDATYEDFARRGVAALAKGQHVSLPGVGHCAHLEAPSATVAAVQAFLAALAPEEGASRP